MASQMQVMNCVYNFVSEYMITISVVITIEQARGGDL